MSDSVNSAALVHLSLTEDEREALEGHRTLVLTSSQALPDCALNCSSFFLNDTLFAVARLYATDEIISLQFPCVNSALINLDSGKPSKCHVCFYDFVLLLVYCHCSNVTSCCIVECSASLAQAIYLLSLLHKGRAEEICAQLSDPEGKQHVDAWSPKSTWRHIKRTGSQSCLSVSEKFISVTFVLNNAFSCD